MSITASPVNHAELSPIRTESSKYYENGIPVLKHDIDPQKLAVKHPKETAQLMARRKDNFEQSGIFLDGFGVVSAAVLMDFRLATWDKLVFAAMKTFSGNDHHARIKVSTIRKATNLGKKQVVDAIAVLTRCGYLKTVSCHDGKHHRARSEYICFDNPKGLRGSYLCKGEYRGVHYEFPMRFDQWGRVSKAVFCDEQLTKYDKLLYVALCVMGKGAMSFDGKHGYLSVLVGGYTKARLQHAFRRLEAFGYIQTTTINQGRHYAILPNPRVIPYPAMFFCNDMFKLLSYQESHQGAAHPDLDYILGKAVRVDDVVTAALVRQEQFVLGFRAYDKRRAEAAYLEISTSVPDYKRVLISNEPHVSYIDLESKPPEGIETSDVKLPMEPSKAVLELLDSCKTADSEAHHEYGTEYIRGFDLRYPKNEFQAKVAALHHARISGSLSEEDEIIYKVCARGGIPEEYGWPENSAKLLKTIDMLLDTVPGIETALENECLTQALQTLRNIALSSGRYKVNGERVDTIQCIHSINEALTIDDGGVTLSGLLQRAAKYGSKNLLHGNVYHFKTAIVHLLENLTRMKEHFVPLPHDGRAFSELQRTIPMWHSGPSCWTFRERTALSPT